MMGKFKTLAGLLGAVGIAAPWWFPGHSVRAAMDCSPGTVVAACAGVRQGPGWWQPAALGVNGSTPGQVTVTGDATLGIPYYVIRDGHTETVHAGPVGVTTWTLPANSRATVYVLPTHLGVAGQAVVTVSVPQTGHQSGTYVVTWPALPPGTPEFSPITIQWLGAAGERYPRNTIPVTYAANAPIFARNPDGPWVSTLDLPASTPAWIRLPADQAGLTVTAIPRADNLPHAQGTEYSDSPIGLTRMVIREAVGAASQHATVSRPALTVAAPAHVTAGRAIPVRVTLTADGSPLANEVVQLTTTAGELEAATVTTDSHGQAEDTLRHAPTGTVIVTAQALGAQGSARIQVTAAGWAAPGAPPNLRGSGLHHPGSGFPWWLVLMLGVAVAVLAWVLVRRRRRRAGEDPEASDP